MKSVPLRRKETVREKEQLVRLVKGWARVAEDQEPLHPDVLFKAFVVATCGTLTMFDGDVEAYITELRMHHAHLVQVKRQG